MIESLEVKNFLSFRDKAKIDFRIKNISKLSKYQYVEIIDNVYLLKLGIVYGANASGKSNFLKAFQFLKTFWRVNKNSKDDLINIIPFVLTSDKNSSFIVTFYANHVKYVYSLTLNSKAVIEESLLSYKTQRPSIIFNRIFKNGISQISFGANLKIGNMIKDAIELNCLPNSSFFSAYNKVNTQISEIEEVLQWINNHFLDNIHPNLDLQGYVEDLINNDNQIKEQILDNLKSADFNISNIITEVHEESISEKVLKAAELLQLDAFLDDETKKKKVIELSESFFEHTAYITKNEKITFTLSEERQSRGTMRVFGLSGALITTIKQNAFLAVDEIESRLHPMVIRYMLKRFLHESNKSQLLVTTHYDNLLNCRDLVAKENIWFVQKGNNASSVLYGMSEEKGVNRITSWQKAYREGRFGAIPNIPYIKSILEDHS